jgi:hypothetical protein
MQAGQFVQVIEERKIENRLHRRIAWRQGFISDETLAALHRKNRVMENTF